MPIYQSAERTPQVDTQCPSSIREHSDALVGKLQSILIRPISSVSHEVLPYGELYANARVRGRLA